MARKKKEETPAAPEATSKPEAKKASPYGWQAVRSKAMFTKPK